MEKQRGGEGTEVGSCSDTSPCVKGCGYYGTSATLNMCSKCYREHVSQEQQCQVESVCQQQQLRQESVEKENWEKNTKDSVRNGNNQQGLGETETQVEHAETLVEAGDFLEVSLQASTKSTLPNVQDSGKKSSRCHYCQKKVGLTGFTCRCGRLFCSDHRYSDKHECSFDYKAENKEMLSKANPQVVSAKLNKI